MNDQGTLNIYGYGDSALSETIDILRRNNVSIVMREPFEHDEMIRDQNRLTNLPTVALLPLLTALNYVAPEVLNFPRFPSKEMDIWALGCTLCRIIKGRDFFTLGIHANAQLANYHLDIGRMKLKIYSTTRVHASYYEWIRAVPDLVEDVVDLLGKMLLMDPNRRTARNAADHKYCNAILGVRGDTE